MNALEFKFDVFVYIQMSLNSSISFVVINISISHIRHLIFAVSNIDIGNEFFLC